jgi:hypothetical protein
VPTPAAGTNVTGAGLDAMVAKWVSTFDATSRTTTSAAYTETLTPAGLCGVSFTAPTSGAVRIDWKADISANSAAVHGISYELRTGSTIGSGTSVLASNDDRALRNDANGVLIGVGVFDIVTGLTGGNVYNVSLSQRTGSGTLTVARRLLIVTQLL